MNCFQHPAEAAYLSCKECGKPLCLDCSRAVIAGQARVCSEVCAKLFNLRPQPEKENRKSAFNRIYALTVIVLLHALAGGAGLAIAVAVAKSNFQEAERNARLRHDDRPSDLVLLHQLGITGWKTYFTIGATLGAASGLVYVKRNIVRRRALV